MTLQELLDYINALRGLAESPSGDEATVMVNLIHLSSITFKSMVKFPFNLEIKTITSSGTSTENMDSDFDDIVGNIEIGNTEYTMRGVEDLNYLASGVRYSYLIYDKTAGLWVLYLSPTPNSGDEITFTQKIGDTKVTTLGDIMPYPEDVCVYLAYDVAGKIEHTDDESVKGEDLRRERELLLKDIMRKYQLFGSKNNRYIQFDYNMGSGFGSIGGGATERSVADLGT